MFRNDRKCIQLSGRRCSRACRLNIRQAIALNRARGAARHWIMGCGVLLLLVVIVLGGVGYFAVRKVKKGFKEGPVDVSAITDLSKSATTDQLLPPAAGKYKRDLVTTDSKKIEMPDSIGSAVAQEVLGKIMPAGGQFAIYKDDSQNLAIVGASDANQIKARPRTQDAGPGTTSSDADDSSGTRVSMRFGPTVGFDFVLWKKQNWGYVVFTTSTAAMDFTSQFRPKK